MSSAALIVIAACMVPQGIVSWLELAQVFRAWRLTRRVEAARRRLGR